MPKFTYFAGDYLITKKDGSRHVFQLSATEAKAVYQKFMWLKTFNIKSIEPAISSQKPSLI
jgi:hypothetical protein